MDFDAKRRERARVFAADHAAADHRQLLRQRFQLEDLVRVVDAIVLEWKHRRTQRRGAGGDQDFLAANPRLALLFIRDPTVCGSAKEAEPRNRVTPC